MPTQIPTKKKRSPWFVFTNLYLKWIKYRILYIRGRQWWGVVRVVNNVALTTKMWRPNIVTYIMKPQILKVQKLSFTFAFYGASLTCYTLSPLFIHSPIIAIYHTLITVYSLFSVCNVHHSRRCHVNSLLYRFNFIRYPWQNLYGNRYNCLGHVICSWPPTCNIY